ncbi:MAG TPA: acyltransferase, partial [Rhodanobacter sp.]
MTAEGAAATPAPAGGIRLRRASSHYLPTLDGWRAVAIGVVLLAHSAASIGVAWPHVPVPLMERSGLFGVEIFFALSGFLITTWLIREEQAYGRISLSAFYTRRVFRILPAASALLLTIAILSVRGVFPVTLGRWLSSLLFVANLSHATGSWYVGHFWSLAVEEHFYLLWPAIFLLLRKNRRRFAFTVFTGLAVALWRAVDFKYHLTITNFDIWWGRTDINADSLSWGVCVALVYADAEWRQKLLRFLSRSFVPIGLAALVIACEWLPLPDWKLSMAALTVKAVAIPLLIVWTLTNTSSWPARLLETAPLRFIGLISYSLYLWQQLFCVETVSWMPGQHVLQSFPANVICAIG